MSCPLYLNSSTRQHLKSIWHILWFFHIFVFHLKMCKCMFSCYVSINYMTSIEQENFCYIYIYQQCNLLFCLCNFVINATYLITKIPWCNLLLFICQLFGHSLQFLYLCIHVLISCDSRAPHVSLRCNNWYWNVCSMQPKLRLSCQNQKQ